MRETFGTLLQTSKDYAVDDNITSTSTLSTSEKFFKQEINRTVRYMFAKLKNYRTQPEPKTASTVAAQIYYGYPPGLNSIETATITVGSVAYPVKVIHSQEQWNELHQISVQADTIPKYIFPRQHDFGVYPTPQAVYTITLVGNYIPINMTADDYTDGTVTITQNTQAITGASTVFTAAMVGRWISPTDSTGMSNGSFYKLSTYSSGTVMTLQGYFEETSLSGSTYLIGESPELPEELHELIPYRVAGTYLATSRRTADKGQKLLNFFYTGDFENYNRTGKMAGGFLGFLDEYKNKGRDNSQLVEMGEVDNEPTFRKEAWGSVLS